MISDRAPSTVKKYFNCYKRWCTWAGRYDLTPLPADGADVALYLYDLMKGSKSPAPVISAVYGISWAHRKALMIDPCDHPLVVQLREAARRILSHRTIKKENLSVRHVRAIVDKFGFVGTRLPDLQITVLIAVGFAGFLRWSDLSSICIENISFYDSHMSIALEKRKNDQYRSGHDVIIARCLSAYCPVSLTERFLARSNISSGSLFREFCGSGPNLVVSSKKLSYSSARSQALKVFSAIGLDARNFGLHSLRSGGATAASEAGVPDRLISSHGGWKSETSRNGYIRSNMQTMLSVSKALDM